MKFLDGHILDNSHIYSLRIHYEDTDIGGIVYHTKYLNFIERARSSLIRLLGFPAEKFLNTGYWYLQLKVFQIMKWVMMMISGKNQTMGLL